ncbi:MAG: neutral zinc metallopeptidase [Propionibacteriaceae bacterium]|jgi:predicted metalloprotease|nr:neutral zinc metallopeptidase [Propionibacteriaceae bacterium]
MSQGNWGQQGGWQQWPPPSGQPWPQQAAQQWPPPAGQPSYPAPPTTGQYQQAFQQPAAPAYQQPQYQAYQQYPQYQQPHYPQRKRSGGFQAALFVLVLVIGGVAFLSSLVKFLGSAQTQTLPQITLPADAPDDWPNDWPTEIPVDWPTDVPVEIPTEEPQVPDNPQTEPIPGVPDPDFNPSSLPAPDTYEEAKVWMEENSLYDQSVAVPTNCQVDMLDSTTATDSELEAHLNELTACLWQVWYPPLSNAGYELPRPPVSVYSKPITTGCGKMSDINAAYCASDQRIYYSKKLYVVLPTAMQQVKFVADTIMAHEFSHAVQARSGILISANAWEEDSTKSKGEEFSRRTEMQADCLAGMFTVAIADASGLSGSDLTALRELMYDMGDDVVSNDPGYVSDHGTGKARAAWFTAGQNSAALATCNTYVADASEVK